jgi:TRAP transporter 4TM/12TM fusion protein
MSKIREEVYDPSVAFRRTGPILMFLVTSLLVAMSIYHYYASGFGLIRELVHRSIHLSFVLGLVFLVFGLTKKNLTEIAPRAWHRFQGVSYVDFVLAIISVWAVLYLPLMTPEELSNRVGNPMPIDVFMGSVLLIMVLEATRRSVGITLPIIVVICLLYALFGQQAPGVMKHSGASWTALINHLYLTNQGIYGVAIGVVSKYVFLFVLFGVLATEIGLGRLFIDVAQVIAGRHAGGPAKVAVFSSALMGTISGSSIANTVTTGALTIPAMKRIGYPPHFAAAVEASSSTGGQITPPIMGAAAFIMVEFLEIPLRQILLAATFPAMMHFFGIFVMVHLEAKKLGLRGMTADELPQFAKVIAEHWMTLFPLVILLYMIIDGYTPDYAAFWSITACIVVGFINPRNRLTVKSLIGALSTGAKYALAVGAAAASVGVIVGVVTLTGTAFRLSYMVIQSAGQLSEWITAGWFGYFLTVEGLTLFFTLVLTAVACIIMGAGVPTTVTYIVLVSIAAPALNQLGIEPLVAHFFVFYYGVLADVTPPVALAAYAGAGIAGANPFRTGNTAFRLSIAKALVPFVFVYSPSLLIVTSNFTWVAFFITLSGCVMGIGLLGTAFAGYAFGPLKTYERWWLAVAALFFVAPGLDSMAIGAIGAVPIFMLQLMRNRRAARVAG